MIQVQYFAVIPFEFATISDENNSSTWVFLWWPQSFTLSVIDNYLTLGSTCVSVVLDYNQITNTVWCAQQKDSLIVLKIGN